MNATAMSFIRLIPDWNSLDSVRHAHSLLEAVALVFFALLVLFDVMAHFSENKNRERLLEKIGLCFFSVAVLAEIVAYPYGQRNDLLSEQIIVSLDAKARDAFTNASNALAKAGEADVKADQALGKANAASRLADAAQGKAMQIAAALRQPAMTGADERAMADSVRPCSTPNIRVVVVGNNLSRLVIPIWHALQMGGFDKAEPQLTPDIWYGTSASAPLAGGDAVNCISRALSKSGKVHLIGPGNITARDSPVTIFVGEEPIGKLPGDDEKQSKKKSAK